ncbi:unnamed protein product [Ectocarpus sp. 6 AP-2014]
MKIPPRSAIVNEEVPAHNNGESTSSGAGANDQNSEAVCARFFPRKGNTSLGRSYACLQTPGLMALNFCSAVGIVAANKALFRHAEGLGFATSLTGIHFLATAVGVRACRLCDIYKVKPLKQTQVLPITLAFCAFVAFNNLSLQYNDVSFYQLMKILTTPAVVVLQLVLLKVVLPFKLLVTLVPICGGVALATANDTEVSAEGASWALAGLLAAAGYQILVKSTQDNLQVSSLQLLHHQAPQAAVMILMVAPFFDDTGELVAMMIRTFSAAEPPLWLHSTPANGSGTTAGSGQTAGAGAFWVGMVFLSCLLAFLVNLSTFLVIGRTSPVSYQVLGHFKLVVILLVGVVGFGEQSSSARLSGMALALAGIVGYTTLKQGLGSGWEGHSSGSRDEPRPPMEDKSSKEIGGGRAGPAYTLTSHEKGRL